MTNSDDQAITEARALADMTSGLHTAAELAAWLVTANADDFTTRILGSGDTGMAYAMASGKASGLITILLDIIDRQRAAINRAETINAELAETIREANAL